jgi:hypothetical protein
MMAVEGFVEGNACFVVRVDIPPACYNVFSKKRGGVQLLVFVGQTGITLITYVTRGGGDWDSKKGWGWWGVGGGGASLRLFLLLPATG